MPAKTRINLVSRLADIENNLAGATSERLQIGGMIAGFTDARAENLFNIFTNFNCAALREAWIKNPPNAFLPVPEDNH